MTYLDPITGKKLNDLPVHKRTIGKLGGSFVELNKPSYTKLTFVSEGIETALSIQMMLTESEKNNIQVIASLGKSNFSKLSEGNTADKIVLFLDNDKKDYKDDGSITRAISDIEKSGKKVFCIQPELINDDKTDYKRPAKSRSYFRK